MVASQTGAALSLTYQPTNYLNFSTPFFVFIFFLIWNNIVRIIKCQFLHTSTWFTISQSHVTADMTVITRSASIPVYKTHDHIVYNSITQSWRANSP